MRLIAMILACSAVLSAQISERHFGDKEPIYHSCWLENTDIVCLEKPKGHLFLVIGKQDIEVRYCPYCGYKVWKK